MKRVGRLVVIFLVIFAYSCDKQEDLFILAAIQGDENSVNRLLFDGIDPNVKGEGDFTALHFAVQNNHLGIVETLLQHGANVSATANDQTTPLHSAAQGGFASIAKLLLQKGANVNAKAKDGVTPLHIAARQGHVSVAKMLVEHGAEVNTRTTNGATPLYLASQRAQATENTQRPIQELLLAHGALKNRKSTSVAQKDLAYARNLFKGGMLAFQEGKTVPAEEAWKNSLKIYRAIESTEFDQAVCLYNIANAGLSREDFSTSIVNFSRALDLFRMIGIEKMQADSQRLISNAFFRLGRYEEAIFNCKEALKLYQSLNGTQHAQIACLSILGMSLRELGRYNEAIATQNEEIRRSQMLQDSEQFVADAYIHMAVTLDRIDKQVEAISYLKRAISLYKSQKGSENGLDKRIAYCWGKIGDAQRKNGHFDEAITAYKLSEPAEPPWFGGSWWILRGKALALYSRGRAEDYESAVKALWEAVKSIEWDRLDTVGMEYSAARFEEKSELFADIVCILAGLYEKGVRLQAWELERWAANPDSASAILEAAFHFADRGKGRGLLDAMQAKPLANNYYSTEERELSQRISKLTTIRDGLHRSEERQRQELSQEILRLQYHLNSIKDKSSIDFKIGRMFETWERGEFGEVVSSSLLPDGHRATSEYRKPLDMARDLPEKTAVLQYSVGENETWLLILTHVGVSAHRLRRHRRAIADLRPREEVAVDRLMDTWKTRPDEIGMDGLVQLGLKRAKYMGRMLPQRSVTDEVEERQILEYLGEIVLPETALNELRQCKIDHLLVIPDGSLHYIPFAMLRVANKGGNTKQYLIEEFSISYVPSLQTLEIIRNQKDKRGAKNMSEGHFLAFANPHYSHPSAGMPDDMLVRLRNFHHEYYNNSGLRLSALPETEAEAIRIGSLFGPVTNYSEPPVQYPENRVVVYTGEGASEAGVKRLLGQGRNPRWQYVLFSTHGMADVSNGMLSCIALSSPQGDSQEDGFLQAQEVLNLEFVADMVVLSACQTGLGRMRSGEGLVGLSRAFFNAGVESTCASLWNVPSGPTTQLITELFKSLKEEKVNRARALRQAQLNVMREGRNPEGKAADYSSPFYWAGFVLNGEFRLNR